MASSQFSNHTVEDRNALYYGKYKYRISFLVIGSGRTRYVKNINDFDDRIKELKNNLNRYYPMSSKDKIMLDNINRDEIETLLDLRDKFTGKNLGTYNVDFNNKVKLYTNDKAAIKAAELLGFQDFAVSEANPCVPSGVMYFKNQPKFKYRIYLKSRAVDDEFKDKLRTFFKTYPEIKATPALTSWLNEATRFWWSKYSQASHFIEFNDEGHYMIILMIFGDFISKHFELQKAK